MEKSVLGLGMYNNEKKTCSKNDKLGDRNSYLRYSDFRFELCKIIRKAKKLYYHEKFQSVKGNIKKHGDS